MRGEMKGEDENEKDERERWRQNGEVRYGICVRLIMPDAALSVPPDGHI